MGFVVFDIYQAQEILEESRLKHERLQDRLVQFLGCQEPLPEVLVDLGVLVRRGFPLLLLCRQLLEFVACDIGSFQHCRNLVVFGLRDGRLFALFQLLHLKAHALGGSQNPEIINEDARVLVEPFNGIVDGDRLPSLVALFVSQLQKLDVYGRFGAGAASSGDGAP